MVAVCHKFSQAACVIKTYTAAIRPLIGAALSLQPSPVQLKYHHSESCHEPSKRLAWRGLLAHLAAQPGGPACTLQPVVPHTLMPSAANLQAHFTPIHAECMRMCLLSKCYSAAQPLLDQELLQARRAASAENGTRQITSSRLEWSYQRISVAIQVDKEATHLAPRDLLLFHYYAGMIQIGLKRFESAIQYLTLCFSAPTQVLNVIMIEAYKKCMLCSLIEYSSEVEWQEGAA